MSLLRKLSRRSGRARHDVEVQTSELCQARLAVSYSGHANGGNCHEIVRVSANRVLFAIFDVAGRRTRNAKVAPAVLSEFRASGANLLANDNVNEAVSMMELCRRVNQTVIANATGVCACPAFAGCFNESLGTVCYFNAGHTPALFAHENGVTELPATGLALGLFSHSAPDAPMIALQPGSLLLVVSRGVVEARYRGRELGLEYVKQSLRDALHESATAGEVSAAVIDCVWDFTHNRPVHNDMTLLALQRYAAAKGAAV